MCRRERLILDSVEDILLLVRFLRDQGPATQRPAPVRIISVSLTYLTLSTINTDFLSLISVSLEREREKECGGLGGSHDP